MIDDISLLKRNLAHHWHPCSQMRDLTTNPPLIVQSAQGDFLHTTQGPVIDGIASWWCKSLGHQHPAIIQAIQHQLTQFEHVISAHTTHPLLVQLTEKLADLSGLPYVFFASDGSSAVEIALKLMIHARQIEDKPHKTKFLSLKQGYHGETLATLSISDLGKFKQPYTSHCFSCQFIKVPYTQGLLDPLSLNAEEAWLEVQTQLEPHKDEINGLIFEPLIQGAGGMRCYSVDFLKRLMQWAKANDIYCLADEIMTGFCRTGKWFATQYTDIMPDLMCISKGLTGGTLPLSAVLISKRLYGYFYQDFHTNHNFLHSHTFSGHALAISAAIATIKILEEEEMNLQAQALQEKMQTAFKYLQQTQKLTHLRGIGGVIAADLVPDGLSRLGYRFHLEALKRRALLRPLGDSLYWFLPLNVTHSTIEQLTDITYEAIKATYHLPLRRNSCFALG